MSSITKLRLVFDIQSPRFWFVLAGMFALASLSWILILPAWKENLAAIAVSKCILNTNVTSHRSCLAAIPAPKDAGLKGISAYYQSDDSAAMGFLRRALQEDSSDPIAIYWLGSAYYRAGDRSSAVKYWRKIERDAMAVYFTRQAESALQEGALPQAIEAASLAAEISPSYGEGYYQLGNALQEAGDDRGALLAYQQAVARQLNPWHRGWAYHRSGLIYQGQGQEEKALQAFEAATELLPDSYLVRRDLADQYARLKRYAEAEYQLTDLLEKDHTDASLLVRLGNLKGEQNRVEEAEQWYRLAILVDPESGSGEYGFGRLYLGLGRLDEAIGYFQKSIDLDPSRPWVWLILGSACWQNGQLDQAIQAYSWVAGHAQESQFRKQAWTSLAKLYTQKGDLNSAKSAWKSVLEIDPADEEALHEIANRD